ncbi:MAG: hypothetical protein ACRDYC_03590 [Acidimicrobiales bacterium]
MATAVDGFLEAIEAGDMASCEVFAKGVEMDATVPNWRFTVRGADRLRDELGHWYASPGCFEELQRVPIPGGELVEFTLCWEESGVPHAVHQVHHLGVEDGEITSDRVWCGGRWPASLLAEMAEAARAAG